MSISNLWSSLVDATILMSKDEEAKEYLPHLREFPMFCPQMDKWDHQQTSCYKQKSSLRILNFMQLLRLHVCIFLFIISYL